MKKTLHFMLAAIAAILAVGLAMAPSNVQATDTQGTCDPGDPL